MRDDFDNLATCNKCNWVYFSVSRAYALKEVSEFNDYYNALPESTKEMFGRAASIKDYERCCSCGNSYKDFREAKYGDCPDGCTIGPILERSE